MRQTSRHSAARHRLGICDSREFTTSINFAELRVLLDRDQRHRFWQGFDRAHVDALPRAGIVLGIGMGERGHFQNADDLALIARVIEEAEVAKLHSTVLLVARQPVAHAVPGLAALAARFELVLPGEHVGFRI